MAYVPQQIPKEEENQFAKKDLTTAYPVPPQGGGSSGQASGIAAPGFATSSQFGSNAAKLSDYLKANQEQAGEFGQQVAGDLTNRYNQTVGSIDQGVGQFNQQVAQGWSAPDQQTINQAATNPAAFASKPENISQFQSWYNGQYTGPQNFEGSTPYQQVNDQVNKAVEGSSLVGTQAGLGTYLNSYLGANDNTRGMQTLDTAILMGDKGSQKAIRDAAAPYKGLNDYLTGKAQSANQTVANAKQQAAQKGQNLQNQFIGQNGIIPNFTQGIGNKLTQERQNAQNRLDTQNDLLQQKSWMTDDQLSALGLNKDSYLNLLTDLAKLQKGGAPLNLNTYASQLPSPGDIGYANVESPEDAATAKALALLTGQDMGQYAQSSSPITGTLPNGQKILSDAEIQLRELSGLPGIYDSTPTNNNVNNNVLRAF